MTVRCKALREPLRRRKRRLGGLRLTSKKWGHVPKSAQSKPLIARCTRCVELVATIEQLESTASLRHQPCHDCARLVTEVRRLEGEVQSLRVPLQLDGKQQLESQVQMLRHQIEELQKRLQGSTHCEQSSLVSPSNAAGQQSPCVTLFVTEGIEDPEASARPRSQCQS